MTTTTATATPSTVRARAPFRADRDTTSTLITMARAPRKLYLTHGSRYDVICADGERIASLMFDRTRFLLLRPGVHVTFDMVTHMREARDERAGLWFPVDRVTAGKRPDDARDEPAPQWWHPYRAGVRPLPPAVLDDETRQRVAHRRENTNLEPVLAQYRAHAPTPLTPRALETLCAISERSACLAAERLHLDKRLVCLDPDKRGRVHRRYCLPEHAPVSADEVLCGD